jgi:hypothetical protein
MLKHLVALSMVAVLAACTDNTQVVDPKPEPIVDNIDNSDKVESISLFASRGILSPGESGALRIITKDATGTILEPTPKLTWRLNTAVLGINPNLTVLAKGLGRTTLTASVNGKTSNAITLEVQAIDAPNSIGRWSNVIDWPVTVAHASIMPDGTLVTFPWRKTSPWGEPITGLGYAAGGMTQAKTRTPAIGKPKPTCSALGTICSRMDGCSFRADRPKVQIGTESKTTTFLAMEPGRPSRA